MLSADMKPMGTFELFLDKEEDFFFRLKNAKGGTLLTSGGYATRAEVEDGVALAEKLAPGAMNYERKRSKAGQSFTLQTYEGEVVGTGNIYANTAERDKAIEAVKDEALGAEVVDLT